MYFVYIIETEDETYYTGITNNVSRRFKEHLAGYTHAAAYLKMHKPKFVVYLEQRETRGDAMRLENRLKRDYKFKMDSVGQRRDIREVIDSELSYR
ncbi:MAG: GIY-YIG nuclease family protein [Candidatus Thorarchaeota archaeon]